MIRMMDGASQVSMEPLNFKASWILECFESTPNYIFTPLALCWGFQHLVRWKIGWLYSMWLTNVACKILAMWGINLLGPNTIWMEQSFGNVWIERLVLKIVLACFLLFKWFTWNVGCLITNWFISIPWGFRQGGKSHGASNKFGYSRKATMTLWEEHGK